MFDGLSSFDGLASLLALTALEIVLSIDNILFLSVIVARLPAAMAKRALQYGLLLALVLRLVFLMGLGALIGLEQPLFDVFSHAYTWRDIILFSGGVFLIANAAHEIHLQFEGDNTLEEQGIPSRGFAAVLLQITALNLVFSIDSVVTAIGVADDILVMAIAVTIAVFVIYLASAHVAGFVNRNPSTKAIALAFLMLVGCVLCVEASGVDVPKSYLYGTLALAAFIEACHLWFGRRADR